MTRKFKIGDTVIYNEITTGDGWALTENDNKPCVVIGLSPDVFAKTGKTFDGDVSGYIVQSLDIGPVIEAEFDIDGFLITDNVFRDGVIGWISRDHCNGVFPGETNQQAFEKQQCIIRLKNMARGGTPLNESVLETAIKLLEGVK